MRSLPPWKGNTVKMVTSQFSKTRLYSKVTLKFVLQFKKNWFCSFTFTSAVAVFSHMTVDLAAFLADTVLTPVLEPVSGLVVVPRVTTPAAARVQRADLTIKPWSSFTARKRSCGKVMFSLLSVCPQGGLPSHNAMGSADPLRRQIPQLRRQNQNPPDISRIWR